MPGDRNIAIAIAVANSVSHIYLTGAINGARAFEQWASAQGYETALILDEDGAVTMPLLRQKIETILQASNTPIHRIIIYFAGHGLIREMEEGLWLLSDWQNELRVVAVEPLKRRLSMYRPRQLCIIADACRSLPANIEQADLTPDAVLGCGPNPADMTVAIDKFIAAQDGTEAFVIPGATPEDDRCIFSGVLVEGLWGRPGLTQKPNSKLEPDKITSQSLASYLKVEVPARAKSYGLSLNPTISTSFPQLDDYYVENCSTLPSLAIASWPPDKKLAATNLKTAIKSEGVFGLVVKKLAQIVQLGTTTLVGGVGIDLADIGAAAEGKPIPFADQLRAQTVSNLGIGGMSGFSVSDAHVSRLWLGEGAVCHSIGVGAWSINGATGNPLNAAISALIEFSDGKFAAPVALPRLFASLLRDGYGVTALIYRDPDLPNDSAAATEEALAALDSGALRADAARDMAAKLREYSHVDPVLAVISAYLYDAIGDTDSIRRMASFFVESGQTIPYDLALLGGLHGTRAPSGYIVDIPEIKKREPRSDAEKERDWTYCAMASRQGAVAGLWPWMRQGWTLLDDPSDVGSPLILPGLVELRASLMRSRFTTLEKDAALELAKLCALKPQAAG